MTVTPAPLHAFQSYSLPTERLAYIQAQGSHSLPRSGRQAVGGLPTPPSSRNPSPSANVWNGDHVREHHPLVNQSRSEAAKKWRLTRSYSSRQSLNQFTKPQTLPCSQSAPNLHSSTPTRRGQPAPSPGLSQPAQGPESKISYQTSSQRSYAPSHGSQTGILSLVAFPDFHRLPTPKRTSRVQGHDCNQYSINVVTPSPTFIPFSAVPGFTPVPTQMPIPDPFSSASHTVPTPLHYAQNGVLDLTTNWAPACGSKTRTVVSAKRSGESNTLVNRSRSRSTSKAASDSKALREIENKLLRAAIEAHNCREMVSSWYKKAYGKWRKGNAMRPAELAIFNQMTALHSESRKLYTHVRHLTTIFSSLTFSRSVPYPQTQYLSSLYSSQFHSSNRIRPEDVMIASTCERLRVECERTLHQSQVVHGALRGLMEGLDSYTMPEERRGAFKSILYYTLGYPSIAANYFFDKRKFAYRRSFEGSQSEVRPGPEEPATISILKAEVTRSWKVMDYALKGLERAVDGCQKDLDQNLSSSPSSKSSRSS